MSRLFSATFAALSDADHANVLAFAAAYRASDSVGVMAAHRRLNLIQELAQLAVEASDAHYFART